MNIVGRNFIVRKPRYAKNLCAVQVLFDGSGFATYEEILVRKFAIRYTHREQSYLLSKKQLRKFLVAYAQWKSEVRKHAK